MPPMTGDPDFLRRRRATGIDDRSTSTPLRYKYSCNIMPTMKAAQVVEALGALAHDYRLAIYRALIERGPDGLPAGAIGERIGLSPSLLTFHLRPLQRARLIRQVRAGRHLIYSADFAEMNSLLDFLTDNCCASSSSADCKPNRSSNAATRRRIAA
jgi:ArsR family transcriptional regulator, arsenate/arsenite/antimonite-responsive transcriptional repressor